MWNLGTERNENMENVLYQNGIDYGKHLENAEKTLSNSNTIALISTVLMY